MPSSLAGRLIFWMLGGSFLLVLVTSGILYWGIIQVLQGADDQILEKRMQAMRLLVQDGNPDAAIIAHEVDEELEGPRQIFIRVAWPAGNFLQETQSMSKVLPAEVFPDVTHAPAGSLASESVSSGAGRNYRLLAVRVPVGSTGRITDATIQVATETTLDAQLLSWYRRLLAGVIGAAALACVLGGVLIVRRSLEPLQSISLATSAIGTRTLDYRLPLEGLPDELRDLGLRFNEMLARLEISYTGLQHYADNIAHELRSPVNRMLLESEVALLKSRTKGQYREAIESNVESCRQLRDIVQSLLFLARVDSKRAELESECVDVNGEIESLRDYFEASADELGVRLGAHCDGALAASLDRTLFKRAISNLISNAIAHTPRGGEISISAAAHDGWIEIAVSDTGAGIAKEHLPHIFERFYRADEVRNSGGQRLGLGLAIAKSIIELHGGRIRIESETGKGTIARISIPEHAA